jgi:hypothetical protein
VTDLPNIIGFRVIDITTDHADHRTPEVLTEERAIRELISRRRSKATGTWVISAVLEDDGGPSIPCSAPSFKTRTDGRATKPYRIEKNISLWSKAVRPKYPWAELEVGDSFFIPEDDFQPSITSTFTSWAKKHAPGAKITTRRVDGGHRVWRVK